MTTVLAKREIRGLIEQKPPLLEDYIDLSTQLQPNGFDLTIRELALPQTSGRITVSDSQRAVAVLAPLTFDGMGFIELMPASYIVTFNEIVNLPTNIMALARPRSSLLRCGVSISTAVWDAGYSGRSQALMTVYNPMGFRLQKDARIAQMVFFKLSQETEGYSGTYQRENI